LSVVGVEELSVSHQSEFDGDIARESQPGGVVDEDPEHARVGRNVPVASLETLIVGADVPRHTEQLPNLGVDLRRGGDSVGEVVNRDVGHPPSIRDRGRTGTIPCTLEELERDDTDQTIVEAILGDHPDVERGRVHTVGVVELARAEDDRETLKPVGRDAGSALILRIETRVVRERVVPGSVEVVESDIDDRGTGRRGRDQTRSLRDQPSMENLWNQRAS